MNPFKIRVFFAGEFMLYLEDEMLLGDYIWEIRPDGIHVLTYCDGLAKISGGEVVEYSDWVEYPSIVMYSIGCIDKNDKDIYEGDLLRYPVKSAYDIMNYTLYEVFYNDDCAKFSLRCHYKGNICGGYIPNISSETFKQMVVVGNIYEEGILNS